MNYRISDETIARLIENVIKILVWIWPFRSLLDCFWINRRHFRSIESNFRSIENRIQSFLKTEFSRVQSLSNFFKTLFSLSLIGQGFQSLFLLFSLKFLQGFLSSKAGKTFIPFLFHLFSSFMHFYHAYWENFEPIENWGFCWFKPFLSKLIFGFLLWDDINLILGN